MSFPVLFHRNKSEDIIKYRAHNNQTHFLSAMTLVSKPLTPHRSFFFMSSPKEVIGARSALLGSPAEPLPKRSRWDMDGNPLTFAVLAASPSARFPRSTRTAPAKHSAKMGDAKPTPRPGQFSFGSARTAPAKHPVEMGDAKPTSRLGQFNFSCDEIGSMLHGDTDKNCTQTNWRGEQYGTQINGLKLRSYATETIVGDLKRRVPAVERKVSDQEKQISSLTNVTKGQGDTIKQQGKALKEQGLMIQKLQELCIKNNRKTGKLTVFSPHRSISNYSLTDS
jgi:hypothetical protein